MSRAQVFQEVEEALGTFFARRGEVALAVTRIVDDPPIFLASGIRLKLSSKFLRTVRSR